MISLDTALDGDATPLAELFANRPSPSTGNLDAFAYVDGDGTLRAAAHIDGPWSVRLRVVRDTPDAALAETAVLVKDVARRSLAARAASTAGT